MSIALFAQPPVGNANKGEEYGAGVSKTKGSRSRKYGRTEQNSE